MFDLDSIWGFDIDRCIVENGSDTNQYQIIDHILGKFSRDSENCDLDTILSHKITHFSDILDNQIADFPTNLLGIDIKDCSHPKATIEESFVSGQATAEISCANDDHVPNSVGIQNLVQFRGEEFNLITFAAFAQFPKVRKILPDLGCGNI